VDLAGTGVEGILGESPTWIWARNSLVLVSRALILALLTQIIVNKITNTTTMTVMIGAIMTQMLNKGGEDTEHELVLLSNS
jgi:hypothetical protein